MASDAASWLLQSGGSGGDALLALVAGFGIGLAMVYDGFTSWRDRRRFLDTPTERVRSVAAGRTELRGTLVPVDEPAEAPFTTDAYLLARWEIEELRSDDDGKSWQTIEADLDWVPFELHDGTGSIRVEPPSDGTFEVEDGLRTRIEVDGSDPEPPAVREYLRTRSSVGLPDRSGVGGYLFSADRRYTQWIVPPGETCYVLGGVRPADGVDGEEGLVLSADAGSGEFVLSTVPEEDLASRYLRRAPLQILGGLCLSAVCLFVLALLFLPPF